MLSGTSFVDGLRSSIVLGAAIALLAAPVAIGAVPADAVASNAAAATAGPSSAEAGIERAANGGAVRVDATGVPRSGDVRSGQPNETHRIEIRSDGDRIEYRFETTGTIRKVDTDTEETVSDGRAAGTVVDGADVFEFTGRLTSFSADGDPTVLVDGEEIDESSLSTPTPTESTPTPSPSTPTPAQSTQTTSQGWNTISISSGGERVAYEFDVDGRVVPEDINTEESVSGGHAEGVVVDGTDVFRYTGPITSFEADGDVEVRINGRAVDPDQLGGTGDAGANASTSEESATETVTESPRSTTETATERSGQSPVESTPEGNGTEASNRSVVRTIENAQAFETRQESSTGFGDGFGAASGLVALVAAVLLGSRLFRSE